MKFEVLPDSVRIVKGLPAKEYHSGPEVSSSQLQHLLRSPAHYQARANETTAAMAFGSLFHTIALEPEELDNVMVQLPDGNWNQKAYKMDVRDFLAARGVDLPDEFVKDDVIKAVHAAGLLMPSDADIDNCRSMADAIWESDFGQRIAQAPGAKYVESSIFYTERVTFEDGQTVDIPCRTRPDLTMQTGESMTVIDLKSTRNAAAGSFSKSISNFGYDRQAYMYLRAMRTIDPFGDEPTFIIGACEGYAPFAVAWYEISDEFLVQGARQYEAAMATYATCTLTGEWPAYPGELTQILPHRWAETQLDDELGDAEEL